MIKNEEIFLRPIQKEDLQILNNWKNDEETYRYLGGGFKPTSIDEQVKWMEALIHQGGSDRRFIICLNHNEKPIGMVGLYGIDWVHRTCELGLFIGDTSVRGKGYGYMACTLLESYGRDYLNLRKLKVHVVADNVAAVKIYERLGFEKCGVYLKDRFILGSYRDVNLMEKFLQE